ncbi:hypothetical protein [Bradyrhizobium cenepequi]|uniref:hypothetical protein n=1 Tax=Bradyrhizobium cenepequi TaxID=2821403 RepID=UPI001CE2E30C|nr:hypothetical protein [Bradyrhizobium cenepequi]MCA6108152.1 hypothetical protein [Bradyrhizobium cenepequi]
MGPSVHELRERDMLTLAPQRVAEIGRAKLIISAVLSLHRMHRDDFFGHRRDLHLVAARRDAAHRLREAGFTSGQIGRILKRNHTTVLNYFDGLRDGKRRRLNERAVLRHVDPELREPIQMIAQAEGVTLEMLIAQWVGERARYEIGRAETADKREEK